MGKLAVTTIVLTMCDGGPAWALMELARSPALLAAVLFAALAWSLFGAGWGPGTHIRMATRFLAEMADRIDGETARLIGKYPQDFLYGNIAADIINFKSYGGVRNNCHHWNMKERIETLIDAEHEYAFLHGYLCHLAADVVAHNHFVPFQLLYDLPPAVLGHTYWEALADGSVPRAHWDTIGSLRNEKSLHQSDRVINAAVQRKALSLRSNKWIFNNIVLARSRKSWRAIMDQMRLRKPHGEIHDPHFERCLAMAQENMWRVFSKDSFRSLSQLDPSGRASLKAARILRRELIDRHGCRQAGAAPSRTLAERTYGLELW